MSAVKKDLECIFLQRAGQRIFTVSFNPIYLVSNIDELTKYAPDVTGYGTPPNARVTVTKMVLQRQPDTRLHCILSNGNVACPIRVDRPVHTKAYQWDGFPLPQFSSGRLTL